MENFINYLYFNDFIGKISNLGNEEWLTVYYSFVDNNEQKSIIYYSALIAENLVEDCLKDYCWDVTPGYGLPGYSFIQENNEWISLYNRFSKKGFEPLVILRDFSKTKQSYLEVIEEFRLYFNLYEDKVKKKLVLIDNNGEEEEVIRISEKKVEIKIRLIKEFLSVKKMKLAIYFELTRYSEKTLEEIGIKAHHKVIRESAFIYSIDVANILTFDKLRKSMSFLIGKKLISGLSNYKPSIIDTSKNFVDFVIGVDEDGKDIRFTSNTEKLADFFGKNKNAPNFLTPVMFKKEVLKKYYDQPGKYIVNDGHVICIGKWDLKIDNNQESYIMVFLGYLGLLPDKEQLYWKHYNVSTNGKISHVARARSFMGEFTDPVKKDLLFKQKYDLFQKAWRDEFGWDLFLPLKKEDEHIFQSLRIPLTNEQKEFDEQVLSITKLLIESLNKEKISEGNSKDEKRSIYLLETFLLSKDIKPNIVDIIIKFLRKLQDLRSTSAAHLKDPKYEKIKKKFDIGNKEFPEIFDGILSECINILVVLEDSFLPSKDNHLYNLLGQ